MMLFSRCLIVPCKYDFARRIMLNDCSLVAFVAAATSTNLAKRMIYDNNDFMPGDNFCKYVQTPVKVVLASFLVVDWKLIEKVRT